MIKEAKDRLKYLEKFDRPEKEIIAGLLKALEEAQRDAERYRWLRARWDADTDEDIEQHTDAMNAIDPDAAIDAAIKGDA